jgi:protein tyrosine phosphatase
MDCCDDYGKCTQGKNCPARCTQDCNQGRDCTCAPKRSLSTGQLMVLYFCAGVILTGFFVVLDDILTKPMSAEQHANKFCQELYGPQTGAHWTDDRMMCQTVRGEMLPAKRP